METPKQTASGTGFVEVLGARQNNLRGIDVKVPRDAFVVFTGVSGSGKSSLAFGTIFAEAQRRYFDSVAPYARRLIAQLPAPKVREIRGLPPAVALQQRRSEPTARSSVGTLTTLSNSLRMLFSRAGEYPSGAARLDSDAFSPNTHAGACEECHGIGIKHSVSETSLVPDATLSIREGAIAAWPGAWQGKNYRDILDTLGYDVDKPFHKLPKKERDWILFTDEKPVVTVHAQREAHRIQRPYQGTYMSAAAYVRHTFATTQSATLRKRVAKFMEKSLCPSCNGKRLRAEALAVKFAGYDVSELSQMQLSELHAVLKRVLKVTPQSDAESWRQSKSGGEGAGSSVGETGNASLIDIDSIDSATEVTELIGNDLMARIQSLMDLSLDYLALDRPTTTLSAGELQRLRLTTQLRSGLYGVVYVLDEPSAGLHPADTEALFAMLKQLKDAGNSLFVVEHEMELIRQADWIVDIGPGAGENGGTLLYSGPVAGLRGVDGSATAKYLFGEVGVSRHEDGDGAQQMTRGIAARAGAKGTVSEGGRAQVSEQGKAEQQKSAKRSELRGTNGDSASGANAGSASAKKRDATKWLKLSGITRHNLRDLSVEFPLGVMSVVTGISGSGKSTLVSTVLVETVSALLGSNVQDESENEEDESDELEIVDSRDVSVEGLESIKRLVCVDQKPIGRTPRSNLATYTGLFDHIRKRFAATESAKSKGFNAGRFSFNVEGGRCTTCEGEGFVSVELLFLPSVYAPCATCKGTRYNTETLSVKYRDLNIAQVLDMTVDAASEFFTELPAVERALRTLKDVGLGYLRLGQPATELSGGEAQRIKLATELQRVQTGNTLYVLDEPTTGLHPSDVDKLMKLMHALVDQGNTVIVVEHDMDVVASADWVIDMGPGAGSRGGAVVTSGTPEIVAKFAGSQTAKYLKDRLEPKP